MKVWNMVKRGAKAVASGIVAGATYLLGVWSEGLTTKEAIHAMTGVQWLGLVIAVFAAWGITYGTRNKSA